MRRTLIAFLTATAISVSPFSAVVAEAQDCSSTAKNYAMNPTTTNSLIMNLCYDSNGKSSTSTSCQGKLNEARTLFTDRRFELFRSLGNGSIAQYNNCRNSSSNQSNTNFGNLNGNIVNVVPRNCVAPPQPPVISSRFQEAELKVSITPATSGDTADRTVYVVAYFERTVANGIAGSRWSSWSPWTDITLGSELSFSPPSNDVSKIALDAYSINACGNSSRTQLGGDYGGISIVNKDKDSTWQRLTSVRQGQGLPISNLVASLSGLPFSIEVLTPSTCISVGDMMFAQDKGLCTFTVTTARGTSWVPETKNFSLQVSPAQRSLTCVKKGNSKIIRKVTAVNPKCPAGFSTKR